MLPGRLFIRILVRFGGLANCVHKLGQLSQCVQGLQHNEANLRPIERECEDILALTHSAVYYYPAVCTDVLYIAVMLCYFRDLLRFSSKSLTLAGSEVGPSVSGVMINFMDSICRTRGLWGRPADCYWTLVQY